MAHARGRHLVEDREGVAHGAVGLLGYHVERLVFGLDTLGGGHGAEMLHHVVDSDTLEVVHLATAEDSRQNLVLLCGREDEDHVLGRLLESLEECVESRRREHVDLVDDKHAVASLLRRHVHLVGDVADVVHRVV